MRLRKTQSRIWLIPIAIMLFGIAFTWAFRFLPLAFATGEDEVTYTEDTQEFFVSIFDDGKKTIVKTSAATVQELLDRLGTTYSDDDIIEPSLGSSIDYNNFYINIYRARPVILRDGKTQKYIMTASHDPRIMFEEAGITVYDGDEVERVINNNISEVGMAESYSITRNGGHRITVSEEIPFANQTVKDYSIPVGSSEVRQLGVVGSKKSIYEVNYVNGREVSRILISTEVAKEPVARITAVGARESVRPDQEICATWARAAGVSEANLSAALTLIYRESGCRVDATNSSSGAYGIPQALPGSKMASAGADWKTNPVTQIRWMSQYVKGRYGGWQQALQFWDTHHWY